MPNWCHDTLTVTGADPEAVHRFIEAVKPKEADLRIEWENWPAYDQSNRPEFEAYLKEVRETVPLTFASLVPETWDREVKDADAMFPGWYQWRCDNWGTKWDANFEGVHGAMVLSEEADLNVGISTVETVNTVVYRFLTAWAPPYPWVQAAAKQFSTLHFVLQWAEPGNDIAGRLSCCGEACNEEDLEVAQVLAPEEYWF